MSSRAPTLVREATLADASAIGEVHAEAWLTAYRDVFEPRWLTVLAAQRHDAWGALMAMPGFARTTLLVAEHGDRTVAFAHVGPHRDLPAEGEIYALYAHPAVWGRGVAAALLETAWDLLVEAGYPQVRVWAVAGANRALRFYTGFGFTETGRTRDRDYGDGRPVRKVEYAARARRLPTRGVHLPVQSTTEPHPQTPTTPSP
jgi:GNAT superfamily N-acetyltransferase